MLNDILEDFCMERVSGRWNESVFCVTQKRTKQNSMFWGTVVEPGARVVITVPSSVQGLRITRALPYEMESGFSRHRLFIDIEAIVILDLFCTKQMVSVVGH